MRGHDARRTGEFLGPSRSEQRREALDVLAAWARSWWRCAPRSWRSCRCPKTCCRTSCDTQRITVADRAQAAAAVPGQADAPGETTRRWTRSAMRWTRTATPPRAKPRCCTGSRRWRDAPARRRRRRAGRAAGRISRTPTASTCASWSRNARRGTSEEQAAARVPRTVPRTARAAGERVRRRRPRRRGRRCEGWRLDEAGAPSDFADLDRAAAPLRR